MLPQQRQEHLGDELEGRRHRVVGAALEGQARAAGREQQRPQHGLQHERDRAGAADREGVFAVADRAGREHQLGAAELVAD
jgi:hypothetical protein